MRLIDADALPQPYPIRNMSGAVLFRYYDADIIDESPTADVEPIKHGKWIQRIMPDLDWICYKQECSECSERIKGCVGSQYCPNCGAKMDKED